MKVEIKRQAVPADNVVSNGCLCYTTKDSIRYGVLFILKFHLVHVSITYAITHLHHVVFFVASISKHNTYRLVIAV